MFAGRVGEGVFGPFEDVAVVKDEWEEPLFKTDEELREASEPTRGDVVPDAEYACGGCGRASEGNLSFAYNGRWAAW